MRKEKNIESIIYLAQCTLKRELVYVGKTHQEFDVRIEQHKQSALSGAATKFHQALIDYGFKNWDWRILATCPQEKEIEEEKKQIKAWNALPVDMLNTTHVKKKKNLILKFQKM